MPQDPEAGSGPPRRFWCSIPDIYPPEAPLHRRLDLEFKIADRIRERIGFDYFADADPRLFDYILVINPQWFTATPPASVETVYRSNAFALYRIRR
jgi:hypothetical protein